MKIHNRLPVHLILALMLLFTAAPAAAQRQDAATLAADVARYFKQRDFVESDDDHLSIDVRGKKYMFIKGTINSSTPRQMERAHRRNPDVRVIVMTNVPGSLDDEANLSAALTIHKLGLWTYIPPKGEVASGGTDMFLAGKRRLLHRRSKVGVHSFGGEDDNGNFISGADIPRDDEIHQLYLEYYRAIGISEDFYWYTLRAAAADDIHYMTPAERKKYRVHTDLLP